MSLDLGNLRTFTQTVIDACGLVNEEATGARKLVQTLEYCIQHNIEPLDLLKHLKAEEAKLPPSITRFWPGAQVLTLEPGEGRIFNPDTMYLKDEYASDFLWRTSTFLGNCLTARQNGTHLSGARLTMPMSEVKESQHKTWVEYRQMLERMVTYRTTIHGEERPVDTEIKKFLADNPEDVL